ncbi:helix-turn-helix transcriptional regulator [Dehalococcoides mccartyi]|nr:helix-turn-helix transcriptional regulator [Dehalococcoides mccartyi]
MTLRDVEQAVKDSGTGIKVSNGHLSLIESGKVANPEPRTLSVLSKVLGVSYMRCMVEARYVDEASIGPGAASSQVAFRGAEKLTPDQQKLLQQFIDQMASKNK